MDAFVGELLRGCLGDYLLYESEPMEITETHDEAEIDNLVAPMKHTEPLKSEQVGKTLIRCLWVVCVEINPMPAHCAE